jgi:hypothetical protein
VKPEQAGRLLDRIGVLQDSCDLDLLLFFVRHPRALLTSDQIATFLGYDVKQLGESLETLIRADLLTRLQRPASAPRLHILAAGGPHGGSLSTLVDLASTREGRLAMRAALTERKNDAIHGPQSRGKRDPIAKAG